MVCHGLRPTQPWHGPRPLFVRGHFPTESAPPPPAAPAWSSGSSLPCPSRPRLAPGGGRAHFPGTQVTAGPQGVTPPSQSGVPVENGPFTVLPKALLVVFAARASPCLTPVSPCRCPLSSSLRPAEGAGRHCPRLRRGWWLLLCRIWPLRPHGLNVRGFRFILTSSGECSGGCAVSPPGAELHRSCACPCTWAVRCF